jgi:hypothetical protein|tara:strand:+ start:55 stop:669 length:615 start_codon:yes stop_codon:yes gene_type:complete
MDKKLFLYVTLVLLWFNAGWTEEKNFDLTDSQIKEIIEKMKGQKKTEEFLQCVEIVRGSNLKRRFLRHQIKKIKCRLKYEELNANYKKEVNIDIEKLKELEKKQQEIEKNKPKLVNLEEFEVTDYESLFYLTKVKLFNNNPNISLLLKDGKYLNFKPGQFISFDDIIVLSEEEFFKLPLKYSEEKLKFRKIIFEFKKEKKKRKF